MTNNDNMTLTFSKVLKLGKGDDAVPYEKVELREPNAGELEKASRADTNIGTIINLVSLVGQIPRVVAEKMSQRDINVASAYFAGFNGGPETAADGQN